jgi:outer membrane receptor protein involved in Fe transport
MTRSRIATTRKRQITAGRPRGTQSTVLRRLPLASAISAILVGAPAMAVHAADTDTSTTTLEEVVVTAQKRTENLQDVPISIEVLDSTKLDQLHVVSLDDYVKYSPSIAYSRAEGQGGNGQPGTSHIYMRGVTSGANENHSGSQPSVGTYLDEQPVTTIDGSLDVHLYDIQRIEVLEGPQGTLYGSSSEAGTVRIITNKPDPTKFEAGYDVEGNRVDHGGTGWQAQGFVNLPLSDIAAIRLVGWDEHDAGFIDNVSGTSAVDCIKNGVRTYPTWAGQPAGTWYGVPTPSRANVAPCPAQAPLGAGSISNASSVASDYNTVETKGGRGALRILLGDNWTVTPSFMGQTVHTNGFFGYDPSIGDLEVTHFGPEYADDSFTQSALTVEGKIGNFDLVYAGAFMKRSTHSVADYSDYSEFYDRVYGSGYYWNGANGKPVMPQEIVVSKGYFQKWSNEVRLNTPQDLPVHGTVGLFAERQLHDIWEQYVMPGYGYTNPTGNPAGPVNPNGLDPSLSIPTLANTIWLTDETRVDRDRAIFGQATWDITQQLSLNGGIRYFTYDNTIQGFYGYSENYPFTSGEKLCFAPASTPYAPCTDLNNRVTGSGNVPRLNLTYKWTPDVMTYATYSKGFRPGGVNRTAEKGIGPYQADFLKNYEIGWKTQWFNHRLRWNGDFFWEDWKNFQFSFLGPNSVTVIVNGGNARIKGMENDLEFQVTNSFNISAGLTYIHAVLTENYCGVEGVTECGAGSPNEVDTSEAFLPNTVGPLAPAGSPLPITPHIKGNLVARYSFDEIAGWKPFGQVSTTFQSRVRSNLRLDENQVLGDEPAYGLIDLVGGATLNNQTTVQLVVTNVADKRASLSRFAAISPQYDNQTYIIPEQPRTIAIKFGQKF